MLSTKDVLFKNAFELMRLIHRYADCGAAWVQFVQLFQKVHNRLVVWLSGCLTFRPWLVQLLDEYQNLGLLRASFDASNCPDYAQRAVILNNARHRLQVSSVDFASVVHSALKLRKKPVRVDFEVRCGCIGFASWLGFLKTSIWTCRLKLYTWTSSFKPL